MVSLYGTLGVCTFTSMPYFRFSFSNATSPCSCPMALRIISCVSMLRTNSREGSSSTSLWSQAHLFHIRLGFGFKGERQERPGQRGLGNQERGIVAGECVAGLGILELGNRHDV